MWPISSVPWLTVRSAWYPKLGLVVDNPSPWESVSHSARARFDLRSHRRRARRRTPSRRRLDSAAHRPPRRRRDLLLITLALGGGYMNGGSQSTTLLAGGGLEAMIPSHSQPSTSKRKPGEDANPLGNPLKKTKKDVCGCVLHVLQPEELTQVMSGLREVWYDVQAQRYVFTVFRRVVWRTDGVYSGRGGTARRSSDSSRSSDAYDPLPRAIPRSTNISGLICPAATTASSQLKCK